MALTAFVTKTTALEEDFLDFSFATNLTLSFFGLSFSYKFSSKYETCVSSCKIRPGFPTDAALFLPPAQPAGPPSPTPGPGGLEPHPNSGGHLGTRHHHQGTPPHTGVCSSLHLFAAPVFFLFCSTRVELRAFVLSYIPKPFLFYFETGCH